MMKKISHLVTPVVFLVSAQTALAVTYEIDLAKSNKTYPTQIIDANSNFEIKVLNIVPTANYKATYKVNVLDVEPLSADVFKSKETTATSEITKAQGVIYDPCQNLNESIVRMEGLKKETEVLDETTKARNALNSFPSNDKETCKNEYKALEGLIAATERVLDELPKSLSTGSEIDITFQRHTDKTLSNPDGEPWTMKITTGTQGKWDAMFGFSFIKNKDESYFTKAGTTVDTFVVTERTKADGYTLIPTILFTWTDNGNLNSNWTHGLTAGLGLDMSNPSVLLGYNWTYHRNIGFSVGGIFNKRKTLNSRYQIGEVLQDAVDDTALVEETYEASAYLSITYRFGESPF